MNKFIALRKASLQRHIAPINFNAYAGTCPNHNPFSRSD